jgi:predicted small metal-binding protein
LFQISSRSFCIQRKYQTWELYPSSKYGYTPNRSWQSPSCADMGFSCGWTASANSEKEVLQKISGHAPSHGIKEITPDLAAKVKSKIKDQ